MFTFSNKYYLPKPYLSYSAISSFMSYPADFRARYYENKPMIVTPELAFGKRIGELLEHNDESMKHVLRYDTAEQELKFEVDGIPILGYIDTFDSVKHKVGEYKTGKTPWTQARVNKHLQLDIYSLGVETILVAWTTSACLCGLKPRNANSRRGVGGLMRGRMK